MSHRPSRPMPGGYDHKPKRIKKRYKGWQKKFDKRTNAMIEDSLDRMFGYGSLRWSLNHE
jgi:hypothetical protein